MAVTNIPRLSLNPCVLFAKAPKTNKAAEINTNINCAKEISGKLLMKYSSAWGQRYVIKLPGELTARRVNINSLSTGETEVSISIYDASAGSTVTSFDGHENMDSNYYFCRLKKEKDAYSVTYGPCHSDRVTSLNDEGKKILVAILTTALAAEEPESENTQILTKTIKKLQEKQKQ